MNKRKEFFHSLRLALLFALIVFLILSLSMSLVFWAIHFFGQAEHFRNPPPKRPYRPLVEFAFSSLILSGVLSVFLSRFPLKPLREIMKATEKISKGDYNTRISLYGTRDFRQLSQSFNHMAEELGNMEILHKDFVNNFSHEFKTPIVSIRGFAKLLKEKDLTFEEQKEYLDIIIEESTRLSELANNTLNLSKLEQQSYLKDKQIFNLTEQIRLVVSLLAPKWTEKELALSLDGAEIFLNGNEELLKQVWINLLDNATKFSPAGSFVDIDITSNRDFCFVNFTNPINETKLSKDFCSHVFTKFYQEDSSHATKGNGLGLAIAKRIVTLHQGEINCQLSPSQTVNFCVKLPLNK